MTTPRNIRLFTRRQMVASSSAALAGLGAFGRRSVADSGQEAPHEQQHQPEQPTTAASGSESPDPSSASTPKDPGDPGRDYTPVITPNGETLSWKLIGGVKVFHLVAGEVDHEFAPGLRAKCWGYNGRVHGPTIETVEGDRVRIYVTNRLPEATSVHWHGILLSNGMDGVAGLTQPHIEPGQTFVYEFTLRQHGTHFYHPHHDEAVQMAMGLMGLFIIHPHPTIRNGSSRNGERADVRAPFRGRDFAFMLAEWRIDPGTYRPNASEMLDFNLLTFNGKAFPATDPMFAQLGDRVRIRLANGSINNHHPIHLHGYQFRITQTDGGQIPESAQWPETTVLVPVGSSRTFEFIADEPGDWAFHCHMLHHTMNQMGHEIPNMIGIDPTGLEGKIKPLLPRYMVMGQDGMGMHGEHVETGHMRVPENSIPMVGGYGPFGYITMGGMFTVLKVRDNLGAASLWYNHPPRTVAWPASSEELRRDGIETTTEEGDRAPPDGHH